MKNIVISISLLSLFFEAGHNSSPLKFRKGAALNLFIITTDGFRWQEVFTGADSLLINDTRYTPDTAGIKWLYWRKSPDDRRKCLMPFLWSVIAANGQLIGNRPTGNRMNTSNLYSLSYPGYNELLTGTTDITIYNNDKRQNPNINLLEFLAKKDGFAGRVAAFTSWNLFPYILNQDRNRLFVNGNDKNAAIADENTQTRADSISYAEAKSYLEKNQTRVLFLALGETDEFAHAGKYDRYLQKAHDADAMIAGLWQWVQATPGYKDNTVFVITTDHGRGSTASTWKNHGMFVKGSSQAWMAILGPGIDPVGEVRENQQVYTKQLAPVMSSILGIKFSN